MTRPSHEQQSAADPAVGDFAGLFLEDEATPTAGLTGIAENASALSEESEVVGESVRSKIVPPRDTAASAPIHRSKEKEEGSILRKREKQNFNVLGSLDALAALYRELFFNHREDAALQSFVQGKWKYPRQSIKGRLIEDLIKESLTGANTWAFYAYSSAGLSKWICIDIDFTDGVLSEGGLASVTDSLRVVQARLAQLGVPPEAMGTEFSGAKGFHCWVFLAEPTPVARVQRFLAQFVAGLPRLPPGISLEYFPHQKTDPKERPFGFPVKLPCSFHRKVGAHSYFIDAEFREIEDVLGLLETAQRWSLPLDLPELTATSQTKSKNKRARAKPKRATDACLSIPQPPLTREIQSLRDGCQFMKSFFERPWDKTIFDYRAWTHAGLILCSLGDIGAQWFHFLSYRDQERYDQSFRLIEDAVRNRNCKPPTCQRVGCALCELTSPLQTVLGSNRRHFFAPTEETETQLEPMEMEEYSTRLRAAIQEALESDKKAVYLLNGPLGSGKTTAMVKAIKEAGLKALWFAPTHSQADEVEKIFGAAAVRTYGLRYMVEKQGFDCPHFNAITARAAKGLSPYKPYCSAKHGICPKKDDCRYHETFRKAEASQIAILMHEHWRFSVGAMKRLLNGRDVLVIDENFLAVHRREVRVSRHDLHELRKALHGTTEGGEVRRMWIDPLLAQLPDTPAALSILPCLDVSAIRSAVENHFEQDHVASKNPLPSLNLAAKQRAEIRTIIDLQTKAETLAFNHGIDLPRDIPVFLLDATAAPQEYALALGEDRRIIPINPADRRSLKRFARVHQCVSAGLPNSSLLDDEEPTPLLQRVCQFIAEHSPVGEQVGIIATKKVRQIIEPRFDKAAFAHLKSLRGLNTLEQVHTLFIVGYQGISYFDLARNARIAFNQRWDDAEEAEKLKSQKEFQPIRYRKHGLGCQVLALKPTNPYIAAYYRLFVIGELEQALGRLRMHQETGATRAIYLLCNLPTSMEIDEVVQLPDPMKDDACPSLLKAAQTLLGRQGAFTAKELAETSGWKKSAVAKHLPSISQSLDLISSSMAHNRKTYKLRTFNSGPVSQGETMNPVSIAPENATTLDGCADVEKKSTLQEAPAAVSTLYN